MPQCRQKTPIFDYVQFWQFGDHPDVIRGYKDSYSGMCFFERWLEADIPMFLIRTVDGICEVFLGDYILTNSNGEPSVCKPDIFESTYEEVIYD